MTKPVSLIAAFALAASWLAAPGFGQSGKGRPQARVELLSSVDAVVPGQAFDVAVHFKINRGWHIYWQNSGDSGMPPRLTWELPPGFTAGEIRYPVPKRHYSPGDIVTNVHEGEPTLLIRVTPPEPITDQSVTLSADVQYLICAKICVRETAEVRLELPVRPSGATSKPANEELFRRAYQALPRDKSRYVTIRSWTEPQELSPGRKFNLVVAVEVTKGYVLPSREAASDKLAAADLFPYRVEGVFLDDLTFPSPQVRELGSRGRVSHYAGRFTVQVSGEVDVDAKPPFDLGGVLVFQPCDEEGKCLPAEAVAFSLTGRGSGATIPGAGVTLPVPAGGEGIEASLQQFGIVGLLFACFIYGLFINATPCVLPLLSIKVLGFVQQAHESRRRTLAIGLTFGAGVVVFFVILGFIAAAGKNVLQYPAAVIGLGAVVTALALSMLGVYTLQVPTAATKLDASIQKEGLLSSFGKGALAPVLGFACTGPLLAGAFGWATQQPPHIAVFAFLFAGFGMASPYVLLGANPNWLSFLPKPGQWMITFERIMGFLLLMMVIWLLHPLVIQLGTVGLELTLGFLVAVGMACWVLGKIDMTMSLAQRWRYRGSAAALTIGAALLTYGWAYPALTGGVKVEFRPWSPQAVEEVVRSGRMAFVDFTSAYCTICKANKKVAVNTPEVVEKIQFLNVAAFQGDFTTGDEHIFSVLQRHDRAGVPLNLIYPAGQPDHPIVLRPNLTKQYLLDKLDEAATSRLTVAASQPAAIRAVHHSSP